MQCAISFSDASRKYVLTIFFCAFHQVRFRGGVVRDLLFEQKPGFSKKGRNVNILFAKLTFGSAYFFFAPASSGHF